MKIDNNKYRCDFCENVVDQVVGKVKGGGRKGTATDQVKCKCGNYISQKTREEINQWM